ncbi:hypothetical protein GOP47_0005201 [Adiantum capillus-veneris]|uniref:DUF1230 family protein n=1 Tax=Adiantum capillus-veneris TaxID=13818 RepID=A0A9D4V6A9_ADICA|nr:hypothetical protein GOP47_0005201 [Adiantum capillus-veneris]
MPLAKGLSGASRKTVLYNSLRRNLSSRKSFESNISLEVVLISVEKAIIGCTSHCSKTLQIFAKLRKGGKSGNNGDHRSRYGRPFSNGNSGLRSPVPLEQQPVNEYQTLVDSVLFSWAVGDLWLYTLKLSAVGAVVALLLGWPIMATSVDAEKELFKCGTGALCGGLLAVTLAALRMYLGWAYVGNRLFSATVEYEETGWYDGEIWIKPPEVLARDRLLGSYKVKPALNRVKLTLIGLAASLASCTLFFFTLQGAQGDVPIVQEDIVDSSPLAGTAYSEASARLYEPDAFASDEQSMLPDYCY